MKARAYWKAVTLDRDDFLDRFLDVLRDQGVRYCLVGGQAVNAYVEPVVSLDLDVVVAAGDAERLLPVLERRFRIERFPHSINLASPQSDLRIQLQIDPRYASFVERATVRPVLGVDLPVASLEDLLQGKIWAVQDRARRASKRQKDLADIARVIEAYPDLRTLVPAEILARLV